MLKNRKILVIGAAGLLGARLTKELLDSGAKVIASDLSGELVNQKLDSIGIDISDSNLAARELDVTCEPNVKQFFMKTDSFDGVVNCSYPRNSTYGKKLYDVTLNSFNENINLHLGSAFLITQQCAAYFERNLTSLSLVNIASIYGVVAPKYYCVDSYSLQRHRMSRFS